MVQGCPHWVPRLPWLVGWLALVLLIVATSFRGRPPSLQQNDSRHPDASLLQTADESPLGEAAESRVSAESREAAENVAGVRYETTIRRPSGPPTIEFPQADQQGRVGSVACSTCHSVRQPNFANRTPADLDQFHQNTSLAHGELACYACHNPDDADTLRLADSTALDYADVMTLCSQCHGTQARDYQHGAHGGMNGYWDLNRGPRIRNNCIDCHDPHVPKFPAMQPTFKPRDRFLDPHHMESMQIRSLDSEAHHE